MHDPNFDPNREITHTGILTALAAFSSDTTGCSNSHGGLCFTSVKNQITGHIKNLNILDELKGLIFQEGRIRDAKRLKGLLIESFPTFHGDIFNNQERNF